MKQYIFTALFCVLTLCAQAQTVSRDYQNESLSKVLEDLNTATSDKTIYFIYDELEDFTVTSHFSNLPIQEAIREVIGFYPMKVTYDGDKIFVECTQKEDAKVIGRIVDENGHPIEFANISLRSIAETPNDKENSTYLNGGVSNENGDFVIPCKAQRIVLKVSFVGYKTVERNVSVGHIGTITLQPETYMVQGVEVKGEIPQYKAAQGGLTVDVQHSILHDIGTANDLLAMLPMIQQGSDGKFNARGAEGLSAAGDAQPRPAPEHLQAAVADARQQVALASLVLPVGGAGRECRPSAQQALEDVADDVLASLLVV